MPPSPYPPHWCNACADELWTLLNFVDREAFADKDAFAREFGELRSSKQLDALHARMQPYLLRREKALVERSVPPKTEVLIEVELTSIQKQYYRAIYEQKTSFLCRKEAKDGPSLSNLSMELRKCCLHLFLVKGAREELQSHFQGDAPVEVLVKASAKMALLDKLLPRLKSEGHRVLIFSQFRIMLDVIEDYLELKQHRYGTPTRLPQRALPSATQREWTARSLARTDRRPSTSSPPTRGSSSCSSRPRRAAWAST